MAKARTKTEDVETTAAEPSEVTDLGDAAATGEHAYAGERADDVAPVDDEPGSPEHLGDSPYAGS